MSRKIVMTLVCILVLGLSGCGDTLTLNQYNTSEIWYIAYTDIDTVCESNELTADGSSILHSEEDYLLLSYVVDSNIEITKEHLRDSTKEEEFVHRLFEDGYKAVFILGAIISLINFFVAKKININTEDVLVVEDSKA